MKQCSFLCKGGWLPLILLPILFMVPLLFFKWGAIESDVAKNTELALSSNGIDWAEVETVNRGRHVLITGTPSDEKNIEIAREIAESAKGVDKVTISADAVPPAIDAELALNVVGDKVVLKGVLANQDEVNRTVANAAAHFGENNVDNQLEIGTNRAKLQSLGSLFQLIKNRAGNGKDIAANVIGNQMVLKGEVETSSVKRDIASGIERFFKGSIDNQLTVAPAPVAAPEPAPVATPAPARNICQESINELLSAGTINFETGKAAIKPDSFALLEQLKETALGCPDAKFEVAGHTDSSGKLESNMKLSRARAQSVINHLIGLGLRTDRFSANGYGPNEPIADNATAAGRAKNRRIEFKLKN